MLSSDRHPKVWVFAFMLYGTLLLGMSVCKSLGVCEQELKDLARLMGGDKWMHFELAFLLSLLTISLIRAVKLGVRLRTQLIIPLIGLSLILIVEEMMQGLSPNRMVELWDLFYGIAGVILGLAIYTMCVFCKSVLSPE